MCQPAPGPRCASDLRKSLAKNKERRSALSDTDADSAERHEVDAERQTLLFELAGTRTGQADLNKRIESETNPAVKADLESYRDRARAAYVSKVELLRTVEAALTESPEPVSDDPAVSASSRRRAASASPRKSRAASSPVASPAAPSASSASSYSGKGGKGTAGASSRRYVAQADTPVAEPVERTSASSYSGKGGIGFGGKGFGTSAPARRRSVTPDPPRTSPSAPRRTSASSYTGKGGK